MGTEEIVGNAKSEIVDTVQEGINFMELGKEFLVQQGPKLLMALAILVIGIFVAKKIKKISVRVMKKSNIDNSAVGFLSQIMYFILLTIVFIAAIGKLGVPTNSFVAAIGGLGIAIGLSLQGNLANLASGILILVFKPFRAGDFIEGNGVSGTVHDIQIMNTILYALDMKKIIIPNAKLTSENVINFSASEKRRIVFQFDIDYSADYKKAMAIIREVFSQDPRILADPEPLVAIKEIVDRTVRLTGIPWVMNKDYWDVYYMIMEQVKDGFDEAGIQRPFQKVMHIQGE